MKKYNPIIVAAGEPNSIFLEIFFKSLKKNKFKSPLVLVVSENLLKKQMKKLHFKKKIRSINIKNLDKYNLDNNYINIIDVNYNFSKPFEKISTKSNSYVKKCFDVSLNIIKKGYSDKFINGPISKKTFLRKNFLVN